MVKRDNISNKTKKAMMTLKWLLTKRESKNQGILMSLSSAVSSQHSLEEIEEASNAEMNERERFCSSIQLD